MKQPEKGTLAAVTLRRGLFFSPPRPGLDAVAGNATMLLFHTANPHHFLIPEKMYYILDAPQKAMSVFRFVLTQRDWCAHFGAGAPGLCEHKHTHKHDEAANATIKIT